MKWHRTHKNIDAHATDERSKRNARAGEQARQESARLTAVAKPIQESIRDQYERNHWAELIFGRLN